MSEREGMEPILMVSSSLRVYPRWRVKCTVALSVFAVSNSQLKSGRRAGRDAARMPMLSSMVFQIVKELSKKGSGLEKNLERRISLTIEATQAKYPRLRIQMSTILVRMLI